MEYQCHFKDYMTWSLKNYMAYFQLYLRVGFVHQFHPLSTDEARFILEHKWQQIGVRLQPDDFSDMEAVATIIRITGGNFRLIHRLCTQIERISPTRERENDQALVARKETCYILADSSIFSGERV